MRHFSEALDTFAEGVNELRQEAQRSFGDMQPDDILARLEFMIDNLYKTLSGPGPAGPSAPVHQSAQLKCPHCTHIIRVHVGK
jgi:hypothetical protein